MMTDEQKATAALVDSLIKRSDRLREMRRSALEDAFDIIDTRIDPKVWESIERLRGTDDADRKTAYTVNGLQAVHMAIPLAHFLLGEGLEMKGPEAGTFVSRPRTDEPKEGQE